MKVDLSKHQPTSHERWCIVDRETEEPTLSVTFKTKELATRRIYACYDINHYTARRCTILVYKE